MATGPTRKTTVLQIARQARVSQAAVYAALNPDKQTTIGISPRTRDRIRQLAHRLGYIRNDLARSLVTGRTHTIAVLVHSLRNHFFDGFFNALDDACAPEGYCLFIANSEFSAEREARYLRAFLARQTDALVIVRDPRHANDELLRQIAERGTPIVTVGELDGANLLYPNVAFDEARGDWLAAEHLWSLGHRRIVHLGATRAADGLAVIHAMRARAFTEAWRQVSGGELPARLESADGTHSGMELVEYLDRRASWERPTAVACTSDRLAVGVLAALRLRGLGVPEDLSVVGYDDTDDAVNAAVPLTTVRLPTDELARQIWAILARRLDGAETVDDGPRTVLVAPELVIRQSTATPPIRTVSCQG